ncbi:MAG: glycosyltransferase family 39 protein [Planctomycetota bacterium]
MQRIPLRCQWHRLLVGIILFAHMGLLWHTIATYSPTVDEVSHLPAGLSHWRFGRFDLYRVNPPLAQAVAAIPLLFCKVQEDWSHYSQAKTQRCEFSVGRRFVDLNGEDTVRLYRYGRLACLPFSLIGAIVAYCFARDLYGRAGGLVALSLWCFSPNILGNAAIITPDAPSAACALLAIYAFWKWLSAPGLARSLTAGLTLGLAELAKTTCLILYVVLPVMWLIWYWRYRTGSVRRLGRECWQMLLIVGLAVYVTNLGYLFDGSFLPLKDYQFVSQTLGGRTASHSEPGNRFRDTILGTIPVPLPADYIHGIDLQKLDFEGKRPSYAAGVQRLGGWWWWYLYALAVKTPHGTMLLVLMAGLASWAVPSSARSANARGDWLVLVPALCILVLVSSQTGFSRYLRYLLPAFPFVYVWAGRVAQPCLLRRKAWTTCVVAALAWNLWSCCAVHPHHLAFFNEFSGGSRNGHWCLLDANVDWGQCSLELKRWLDDRRRSQGEGQREDVYLSCFADHFCMRPEDMAIEAEPLPLRVDGHSELRRPPPLDELPPGLYAISVNHLHAYRHTPNTDPDCSEFLKLRPIATIGYAIQIFQLPPANPAP